jgi:hypothetical protein
MQMQMTRTRLIQMWFALVVLAVIVAVAFGAAVTASTATTGPLRHDGPGQLATVLGSGRTVIVVRSREGDTPRIVRERRQPACRTGRIEGDQFKVGSDELDRARPSTAFPSRNTG